MADSDDVRLRVQFLKGARRNLAHRHELRAGDLRRRKFPRLANIQQDQPGFPGFKASGDRRELLISKSSMNTSPGLGYILVAATASRRCWTDKSLKSHSFHPSRRDQPMPSAVEFARSQQARFLEELKVAAPHSFHLHPSRARRRRPVGRREPGPGTGANWPGACPGDRNLRSSAGLWRLAACRRQAHLPGLWPLRRPAARPPRRMAYAPVSSPRSATATSMPGARSTTRGRCTAT